MDAQLHRAPCSYLTFNDNLEIISMNESMKQVLRINETPKSILDILTIPSKVYFQTYFTPAMEVHGKVREMYMKIKSNDGQIPVVMNANEYNGIYECILMKINTRDEYEKQLLRAKQEAMQVQEETDNAYRKLKELLKEVEAKQQMLVELNDSLQEMATLDELTRLYNRRMFQWKLTALLEERAIFSLAIIDIDYFKKVNDTYGHHTGDKVLYELARKLQANIKSPHIVARIGGEEFAIIYRGNKTEIKEAVQQLHKELNETAWEHIDITVSIGLAAYIDNESFSTLYERADKALYEAKEAGRNRVVIY